MASVTFDLARFHLASDLDQVAALLLSSVREASGRTPEVRNYAGGRRRAIVRADARNDLLWSSTMVDRAIVDQLREWADAGELLLFRGPRGRVLHGVLQNFEVEEGRGEVDFAGLSATFAATTDTVEV